MQKYPQVFSKTRFPGKILLSNMLLGGTQADFTLKHTFETIPTEIQTHPNRTTNYKAEQWKEAQFNI